MPNVRVAFIAAGQPPRVDIMPKMLAPTGQAMRREVAEVSGRPVLLSRGAVVAVGRQLI